MKIKALRRASIGTVTIAVLVLASGCGGASPASVAPSVPPSATASDAATSSPSAGPVGSPTPVRSGEATVEGPSTIEANTEFDVAWTGPDNQDDYITIVAVGTTKWTVERYFYTRDGSPGKLLAPVKAGEYELWYVNGADDIAKARRAITVTSLASTLDAPAQVQAGAPFQVAWTGPDGPSDYVTIVALGAARWTNEVYFYTRDGSPGPLVAPIQPGAYEVWYVTGQETAPQTRRPVTVTPFVITLQAPDKVKAGAAFQVAWTGPNGPRDYITIVPAGSAQGTYTNYAYTASGSPATLTAPDQPGNYEIWYASDRVAGTFSKTPIVVE